MFSEVLLEIKRTASTTFLRTASAAVARVYCQPSQWRGGIMLEAFKGRREAASEVVNFQSFFVSSIAGKAAHRLVRAKLGPAVETQLHELHCGVSKGRAVTSPAACMKLIVKKMRRTVGPAPCSFWTQPQYVMGWSASSYWAVSHQML